MKKTQDVFHFQPIGTLESCYKDKFGVPRQSGLAASATAVLHLNRELQPELVLQGLEGFSHLWVVWVFHQAQTSAYRAKIHPPRLNGETMGVFATRSPHRPNPIGLSLVEILKIEDGKIWLGGGDFVEGTPVLDIKPYLPEADTRPEARAGWAHSAERPPLAVRIAPEAEENLTRLQAHNTPANVAALIRETIGLDPRPEIYRGEKANGGWRRHPIHAFRLFGGDVHFKMLSDSEAEVFQIDVKAKEILPSRLPKDSPAR